MANMLVVKDAMVLIHLAKITLLEASCNYFGGVMMPPQVHNEIMAGREKGYSDAALVSGLVKGRKIGIKKVSSALVKKAEEFSIYGGEAEAVALYWQEKADLLATDDDNVRKKRDVLNLRLIGTPSIILKLYREGKIDKHKFIQSSSALRKIGWFSSSVIDRLLMEEQKK